MRHADRARPIAAVAGLLLAAAAFALEPVREADSTRHSPTWNDVAAHEFRDGVHLHAIGGEQVCICRATYAPGKEVPLHSHEHTEQVMVILDGEVTMTIAGETKTLVAGDVVVVNRGIEHALY